ncbi:MAG TPA: XRE family transcriptional regulator [Clostridium sp.]|nr:XRE family transcriptional regulator [Clostridium sp.]
MNTGEFLRSLREKNNLTLKELADKSGVGPSTISDIETGTSTNPRMGTLKKLADALDISVNDFFNDSENKTSASSKELTSKDYKDISKDLDNIMKKLDNQEDGPRYFDGDELDDENRELFKDALEFALKTIKVRNKEKYTPKKYKK